MGDGHVTFTYLFSNLVFFHFAHHVLAAVATIFIHQIIVSYQFMFLNIFVKPNF